MAQGPFDKPDRLRFGRPRVNDRMHKRRKTHRGSKWNNQIELVGLTRCLSDQEFLPRVLHLLQLGQSFLKAALSCCETRTVRLTRSIQLAPSTPRTMPQEPISARSHTRVVSDPYVLLSPMIAVDSVWPLIRSWTRIRHAEVIADSF